MPKVGDQHFAYTSIGEQQAKNLSKQTGQPIERYRKAGAVTDTTKSGCTVISGYEIEES
jgi:hypothetical protein